MKLTKFKESNHKKIGIILFTISCVLLVTVVFLYKSFAIFETNENKNIIKGNVEDRGDLRFYVYVDNKLAKDAPNKDSGYSLNTSRSYCENGSMVSWNEDTWSVEIKNMSTERTKCYLYFEKLYRETELNGAIPDLGNGRLVPITYETKETGPIVKKADVTKEWYNYGNQQWANAVITGNSYDLLGSNVHDAAKVDGAVQFDGQDDYIDLGLTNYQFTNGITLAITVKLNALAQHKQEFFGNWENGGGGGMGFATNGGFYTNLYTDEKYLELDVPLKLNEYYTIITTYDNKKMKLYINGEQNQEIDGSNTIKVSNAPIAIGANPSPNNNKPGNFSNIDVKQAAIFNRALTEEEITDISNNNFKITNGEGLLKYVDFTDKKYQDNEVIPEDNIESYFVWIPRYEYQLWNGEEETLKFTSYTNLNTVNDTTTQPELNKQQKINIKFVTKNDELKNGNTKNSWLTHPAFTSFDSNGFWIGKFETGYEGAKNAGEANQNKIASESIIIKPNVYSWRGIQVGNAFYTAYDYKRELDSHMMKNMEWGAVAYLATSEYGLCKGGTCTNIMFNNNSNYITGYASSKQPTCGYTGTDIDCHKYEGTALGANGTYTYNYNDTRSQTASTTGNYYGIYDMSGGAWEYVMGVMLNSSNAKPLSGTNKNSNSKFNGPFGNDTTNTELTDGFSWPSNKYYDTYSYTLNDDTQYQRGKFGDATKEVGPFYQITSANTSRMVSSYYADHANFTTSEYPWLVRGGYWSFGSETGLMAFSRSYGQAYDYTGFRIVLFP